MSDNSQPTTSPAIELRMTITDHHRRARAAVLAGDDVGAEREERVAADCEARLALIERAA